MPITISIPEMRLAALFCLIAIFAACSVPAPKQGNDNGPVQVAIPENVRHASDDPALASDDSHIVTLTADAEWHLGKKAYSDKYAFRDAIASLVKDAPDKLIYFKGDKDLGFGQIREVLDSLRRVGVKSVGLVTGKTPPGSLQRLTVQLQREPDDSENTFTEPRLKVEIDAAGNIRLGKTDGGRISQPEQIANLLTLNIKLSPEKSVTIKPVRASHYIDVVRLIDAVTGTEAESIILALDDLNDK